MSGHTSMRVNDRDVCADVSARVTLADFLRDELRLTGTHLSCEQGVCGACNVLIDGHPVRSCLTLAAGCAGMSVHSIEGLQKDPVMQLLQAAFRRHHALQCGYCTPGMLIAARDVVLRFPQADEATVRREMSGNLCRCTGYAGIVAAVLDVIRSRQPTHDHEPLRITARAPRAQAAGVDEAPRAARPTANVAAPTHRSDPPDQLAPGIEAEFATRSQYEPTPDDLTLSRTLRIERPIDTVWDLIADPRRVAACMPGLTLFPGDDPARIDSRLKLGLGPVRTVFVTRSWIDRDEANRRGSVISEGRDARTNTRFASRLDYALHAIDADNTELQVSTSFRLSGALAQFARTGIVTAVANRLANELSDNLRALIINDADGAGAAQAMPASGFVARLRAHLLRLFGASSR